MNSSSRTPKRAASRPAISGGAAAAPDAAAGGATATRGRRRRRGSAAAAAAASTIEPGVAAAGQLHPGRPAHDRRRGRRAWRHDDITVAMLSDGGYLDLPIQVKPFDLSDSDCASCSMGRKPGPSAASV